MTDTRQIELFVLKCASLQLVIDDLDTGGAPEFSSRTHDLVAVDPLVDQFSNEVRVDAAKMSEYYRLFYMLENDIRKLIDETLIDAYGQRWWDDHSPPTAKEECRQNQQREQEAGYTSRSDSELDYISFGQLGDIIRHNWTLFGGILSNPKALGRVMFSLNNLRGPIAHCGMLAEDEVDRLKLAVKDWFRLLEGPK